MEETQLAALIAATLLGAKARGLPGEADLNWAVQSAYRIIKKANDQGREPARNVKAPKR